MTTRWRERIGDINGIISLDIQEPGFGPAGIPIEIRLQGEDLEQLKQASNELATAVKKYKGTFNVLDDLRLTSTKGKVSCRPAPPDQ